MTNKNHASAPAVELGLLLLLATLWGGSYSLIKLGVQTFAPVTLVAARTLIAGALLLAVLRCRGIALPTEPAAWRRFLFQACLNSVLPFTLIAWAEREVDAGLATILNSTSPVFAFLLAWPGTRGSATRRQLFGVTVGLAGICLVVGTQAFATTGHQVMAQLAIVAATVCYAGAAVFGRNFTGLDPTVPAAGSMLCGAMVLVPASLLLERPWTLAPSLDSLLALLGLSVFCTALAFVVYFRLVHTLGALGTTSQVYLRVPIGVAISAVLLGESLNQAAWAGLACVVVGVAAMTLPSRARGGEA